MGVEGQSFFFFREVVKLVFRPRALEVDVHRNGSAPILCVRCSRGILLLEYRAHGTVLATKLETLPPSLLFSLKTAFQVSLAGPDSVVPLVFASEHFVREVFVSPSCFLPSITAPFPRKVLPKLVQYCT